MGNARTISSFLLRGHPERMPCCKTPATEPPAGDAAEFSYLVAKGCLTPGKEHETCYDFVIKLIEDATWWTEEVDKLPWLRKTKRSAGHDLFRLTNEISYFKQEMDKIKRELTTLDLGPKEYRRAGSSGKQISLS